MDYSNTRALLALIEPFDQPSQFLLDTFFPDEQTFDSEEVYFDKLSNTRQLAPFVSPLVAGKPMRSRGHVTKCFKPAYVKPFHAVEPAKALKRRAGERLGGELSPERRRDLAVADNLLIEDQAISRTEEWMASQILRTGSVTVEGEDYPTQVVDFGRDSSLTVALTSTARWGETGVDPLSTLRTWGANVANLSGAAPRLGILDPLAAELFQNDAGVREILDNRRQASGSIELSPLISAGNGEEVAYIGSIGQFEFYQYQQIYNDRVTGAATKMLPDYTVLLGAPKTGQGVRTYGAILDDDALRAMARFPKSWKSDNPSVRYTMTQSAPLPVLPEPNAVMCATVR
jgi:hypothetical protein